MCNSWYIVELHSISVAWNITRLTDIIVTIVFMHPY